MSPANHPQRIAKLTALSAVLEWIEALPATEPRSAVPHEAAGATLAEDLVSSRSVPEAAVALRDGWAVRADLLSGAGSYSPVPLSPPPVQIDAGTPMPPDTDAVMPLEAVRVTGDQAEAISEVAPGDGVLLASASVAAGAILSERGTKFRPRDVAVAVLAGIDRVAIRRPRMALVRSKGGDDPVLHYLRRAVEFAGGEVTPVAGDLQRAFEVDADAVIAIGGTGTGSGDSAVVALAKAGEVFAHGIAISPGETSAIGFVNGKPVVILPGRFDAAFGAWLLFGRALAAQLAGSSAQEPAVSLNLARKISSGIGVEEVILVRRDGPSVIPLAAGYFPLEALARADGWVRVPPASEGFPVGVPIDVLPMPDLL